MQQSLAYFGALKQAGVPAELHIYAQSGHAFGLRPTKFPVTHWLQLAVAWLRTLGILAG